MRTEIERHASVRRFLDRICAQVGAKAVHEDIRLEMASHLAELVEEKVERDGMTEEEAVQEALLHMGDPDTVGKQLHLAHRPRPEWSVIALAAVMLMLGLVTLFSLNAALEEVPVGHKVAFALTGIAAMSGLYFADYRKLLHLSGFLYGGTLFLLAVARWRGPQINGSYQWIEIGPIGFNICAAAPYLLVIAAAGMLHGGNGKAAPAGGRTEPFARLARETALYVLIPACLIVQAHAFVYLFIYGLGLTALLLSNGKWKLLLAGAGCGAAFLFYARVYNATEWLSIQQRLTAYLSGDLYTAYHTVRSVEAVHSGGMWGQGFGAALRTLPDISREFAYTYLVYSLGWVFGVAAVALTLLFVGSIVRMGMKLPNGYAKSLIVGLASVIGIQYAWNVSMCVGLLPVVSGMQMPILNWSANTFIELGALGLMLGAYRRKDMLGGQGHAVPQ